jgi:protein TonB
VSGERETSPRRARRLVDRIDRHLQDNPRTVRAALATLGMALLALLAAAAWPILLEMRAERATAEDPRPAYVDALQQRINGVTEAALKNAPKRDRPAGLKVVIEVDAEGRLASMRLTESSGEADLDELALGIIRSAAPFEPFSPEMRRTTSIVEVTSEFHFH